MCSHRIEDLPYPSVKKIADDSRVALVPVGSFEAHGSHLPLSTDTIIAESIAELAAEKLETHGISVLVGPLIVYGCSGEHSAFPGTISLSVDSMISLVCDVCLSLRRGGFDMIILLNGHGGNEAPLKVAAVKLRDALSMIVGVVNWFDLIAAKKTDHGGHMETSIVLSAAPSLVKDFHNVPAFKAVKKYVSFKAPVQIPLPDMWVHTAGRGYLGDPSIASKVYGSRLLDEASDNLVNYVVRVVKFGHLFGRIF